MKKDNTDYWIGFITGCLYGVSVISLLFYFK